MADIFVHDLQTGVTRRVSVSSNGEQANGQSLKPSISADGRFVAFESEATNLASEDTNGAADIFVHDLQTGVTRRVSVSSSGAQAYGGSHGPSISYDGRFVAFESQATNLASGDTTTVQDIYVHDLQTGVTEWMSVTYNGYPVNGSNHAPTISADGRFVLFYSLAYNLVSGDTGYTDVFVRDRKMGMTSRVSVTPSGQQAQGNSNYSSISADGRFAAFSSTASNLVSGDTNSTGDIFVHDRQTAAIERVSVSSNGEQANSISISLSISADGRFVAFSSYASNLVSGDTNNMEDIFVHDRCPDGSCGGGHTLFGRIVDQNGAALAGVTLTVHRSDGSVAASFQIDSDEGYFFYVLPAGVYHLIPNITGYKFTPEALTVQLDRTRTGLDFTGAFISCGPTNGNAACPLPFAAPFLDLPFDYSDFQTAALGYQDPSTGGRVLSWFDHARSYRTITWIWNGWAGPAMDAATCTPRSACYEGHNGIDFSPLTAAVEGADAVKAAAGGEVVKAVTGCSSDDSGDACGDKLGEQVWVDHGNGYATIYGNLAPDSVQVQVGDDVSQGQVIGRMGKSGDFAGEHLHFMLLFDANGDGTWDRDKEMVDPYGWSPPDGVSDFWSIPSLYMWKHPLYTTTYISADGGICTGPDDELRLSIPAGISDDRLMCRAGFVPPPAPAGGGLRLAGSFFVNLQNVDFVFGDHAAFSPFVPGSEAYTLSVAYPPESLAHLDESELQLYRWDESGWTWAALPTSLDQEQRLASAQTGWTGHFTLQAPLVCPADTTEPYNDTPALAVAYPKTSLPLVARHLFDIAGDEDWTTFTAEAGQTYTIRTEALAAGVDTVLQVFAGDRVTELAADDNGAGGKASRLVWTAPESGVYHVRVSSAADGAYGCDSGYDLGIAKGVIEEPTPTPSATPPSPTVTSSPTPPLTTTPSPTPTPTTTPSPTPPSTPMPPAGDRQLFLPIIESASGR